MLFAMVGFTACSNDDVDTSRSIFETQDTPKNTFDEWLYTNFVKEYNVDYKYRFDNNEADHTYNLIPAEMDKSMKLAKIIKHVWLEAYVEVAGANFMKKHAPGILQIVGSAAWNNDGTYTLGTAEGGLKITLYMANWLDPTNVDDMNRYFFKTMHHEFTHILQQDINYPQEYNLISASDYRPSGWNNRSLSQFAPLGFITAYAGSSAVEDITELTCCYITYTDEQWNQVYNAAGTAGQAKIDQKVEIMKQYMQSVWNIDMDKLKEVVNRRMSEVSTLQLLEPDWESLLSNSSISREALQLIEKDLKSVQGKVVKAVEDKPHCCHAHAAQLLNILNHQN